MFLADLHQKCFLQPWSEQDFALLLSDTYVFGFSIYQEHETKRVGFVLARSVADQAEILTLGVLEPYRCQGFGWRLLHEVLHKLYKERISELFLEVCKENKAAIALYTRMGFYKVGNRKNYYPSKKSKEHTQALVMRRDILKDNPIPPL